MGSKSIIEVSRRRTSGKVKSSLNKRLENVKWGKFKLKDLFEIFSSKKIYHANQIDKIYDNHVVDSYPYIVRTTQNNGLRGYIKESKETFEEDLNGHTPLFKATEINFSEKNYIPYLQIVWEDNKIKYKKKFASIARQPLKKQPKLLDSLGGEMVKDIRQTLFNIQVAPQDKKGCIYGSVTFVRIN